jgi:hypothetical protein
MVSIRRPSTDQKSSEKNLARPVGDTPVDICLICSNSDW